MNEKKGSGDKLNVVRGAYPFTKYKIVELAVCAVAVIVGLLYLYADFVGLGILLPVYIVLFAAVSFCRYMDVRSLGGKGFAAYLPTFCWMFLTLAIAVAAVVYYVWY